VGIMGAVTAVVPRAMNRRCKDCGNVALCNAVAAGIICGTIAEDKASGGAAVTGNMGALFALGAAGDMQMLFASQVAKSSLASSLL
jgi:hypothetical protein